MDSENLDLGLAFQLGNGCAANGDYHQLFCGHKVVALPSEKAAVCPPHATNCIWFVAMKAGEARDHIERSPPFMCWECLDGHPENEFAARMSETRPTEIWVGQRPASGYTNPDESVTRFEDFPDFDRMEVDDDFEIDRFEGEEEASAVPSGAPTFGQGYPELGASLSVRQDLSHSRGFPENVPSLSVRQGVDDEDEERGRSGKGKGKEPVFRPDDIYGNRSKSKKRDGRGKSRRGGNRK